MQDAECIVMLAESPPVVLKKRIVIFLTSISLASIGCFIAALVTLGNQGILTAETCKVSLTTMNFTVASQETISWCSLHHDACLVNVRSADKSCTDFAYCGVQCVYKFSGWYVTSFIVAICVLAVVGLVLLFEMTEMSRLRVHPCFAAIWSISHCLWAVASIFTMLGRGDTTLMESVNYAFGLVIFLLYAIRRKQC
jgi:hypothetical protein